jgi:hypothetical protein
VSFRDAERGLSFGIFEILIIGLGTFALLYAMVDPVFLELIATGAAQTSDSTAATGRGYIQTAWTYLPLFALIAAAFAFLARAVTEQRRAF